MRPGGSECCLGNVIQQQHDPNAEKVVLETKQNKVLWHSHWTMLNSQTIGLQTTASRLVKKNENLLNAIQIPSQKYAHEFSVNPANYCRRCLSHRYHYGLLTSHDPLNYFQA